jgi:hypothetical protein
VQEDALVAAVVLVGDAVVVEDVVVAAVVVVVVPVVVVAEAVVVEGVVAAAVVVVELDVVVAVVVVVAGEVAGDVAVDTVVSVVVVPPPAAPPVELAGSHRSCFTAPGAHCPGGGAPLAMRAAPSPPSASNDASKKFGMWRRNTAAGHASAGGPLRETPRMSDEAPNTRHQQTSRCAALVHCGPAERRRSDPFAETP